MTNGNAHSLISRSFARTPARIINCNPCKSPNPNNKTQCRALDAMRFARPLKFVMRKHASKSFTVLHSRLTFPSLQYTQMKSFYHPPDSRLKRYDDVVNFLSRFRIVSTASFSLSDSNDASARRDLFSLSENTDPSAPRNEIGNR